MEESERKCVVCGKPVIGDRVTCSSACRQKLYRHNKRAREFRDQFEFSSDERESLKRVAAVSPGAALKVEAIRADHGRLAAVSALDALSEGMAAAFKAGVNSANKARKSDQ